MPYTQFVEVGRVAIANFGPLADHPVVVVDVIDDKRVLIDVLNQKDQRQVIPVKRLRLTDFVVKINRGAAPDEVVNATQQEKIEEKWAATKWAQRIARSKARNELNDFQRFKHAKLQAQRNKLIKEKLAKH